MFVTIPKSVNFSRCGDIGRDGFDRDISYNESNRPLIMMPAATAANIDIWTDTDSRAGRRGLASRGDTFAASGNLNQSTENPASQKVDGSISEKAEARTSETQHRYDLKHAVVRMLRKGVAEDKRSHSVCGCGCAAYDKGEEDGSRLQIPVHRNDAKRAWVSGVYRCKSSWLCPTCAPAVARRRQQAVQAVVEKTIEANGVFLMGLVTVAHSSIDRLADVKVLVTDSFAAARRQKNWERAEATAGVAGVLVAPEVTFGEHGWHFHLHFGIICLPSDGTGEMNDAQFENLEDIALAAGRLLIANFHLQVANRGGRTVDDGQGIQIAFTGEAAADYIAKGISWELTGGNAHKDKVKGQSVWQIVEDADAGDINAFARFREYADVMPGSRSCIITSKLRKRLALPEENDGNSDNLEQQFEDGGRIVGYLETYTWVRLLRAKLAGTFLSQIESISGDVTEDAFDQLVADTTAAADKAEGVITLKRAAKIRQSAADEAAGHTGTRVMLANRIARIVRNAPTMGRVDLFIIHRLEILRAEGHPDIALPDAAAIVREVARLDRCSRNVPAPLRAA